jgi:hypothetical protein
VEKGETIMKTTKWMKASMTALFCGALTVGSAALGHAYTEKNGAIGSGCSGSCMDVWRVDCKNVQTHRVRAIVRDPVAGYVNILVTALGYTPAALLGKADPEVGNLNWSSGSDLIRPGSTHAATKALVLVSVEGSPYQSSYEVRLSCLDANGAEVTGLNVDPTATLLQNDKP